MYVHFPRQRSAGEAHDPCCHTLRPLVASGKYSIVNVHCKASVPALYHACNSAIDFFALERSFLSHASASPPNKNFRPADFLRHAIQHFHNVDMQDHPAIMVASRGHLPHIAQLLSRYKKISICSYNVYLLTFIYMFLGHKNIQADSRTHDKKRITRAVGVG